MPPVTCFPALATRYIFSQLTLHSEWFMSLDTASVIGSLQKPAIVLQLATYNY